MTRRALGLYGMWTLLLLTLYALVPSAALAAWAVIVLSNAIAIGVGIYRNNPRRKRPWLLLGANYLTFAAGTMLAYVLAVVLDHPAFPSVVDALYLGVSAPILLLALWGLSRSGAAVRDRASVIDALILTAGAGFLSWVFVIHPYLESDELNTLEKAVSVAYPLCDVLTLAILARLVITVQRSWTVLLLLTSVGGLLAADVLYSLDRLNGHWEIGTPIDLLWLLFYIAGGAAVLHPSMRQLTEPRVLRRNELHTRRAVLGMASLIAPTVLFVQAVNGTVRDGMVIALVSGLLVLLAMMRMSTVVTGLRRTTARERELRRACEALLSTTDETQVRAVVHRSVQRLLAPGTPHRVVLALHEPGTAGDQPMGISYVRDLPGCVASGLPGFELALCCRLSVGDREVGELFVAAAEPVLVPLQETLPVLAGQAASMLDHIALNREINKRESEEYFRTLVLGATDVILIVDGDSRITYASPAAKPVLGTADLVGTSLLDLVDPADAPTVPHDEAVTWRVRRPDGALIVAEVVVRDLRDEPTVGGLVLTMRDVTEQRRLQQELLDRAYLDPLTGLGNRLRFQDLAQKSPDAILVLNLDDFSVVNDSMGQDVGDGLLIAVSDRLSRAFEGRGAVARLGADEFGGMLDEAADVADVERFTAGLVEAFEEPFLIAGSIIRMQLSIGVATVFDVPRGGQLLAEAHIAMGAAKREGKGRWRRYEGSLHAQVASRMQLRTAMDAAIDDGQFVLHFQPIVELSSGRTRGFEALVRWLHPTRGMIPPLQFIEIAEESGLIVKLGAWVLEASVAVAARWQAIFQADPPYVSVNVSVRQFRTAGFVDLVFETLTRHGVHPDLLMLEITESLLLGDDDEIRADISRLRNAGIRISIDDFGTGYSSLSYLHRVPVDALKLDKSFVDTIAVSSKQLDLVRGIIQLAGTLQMSVVAEGIETLVDNGLLRDAGCRFGQGYLYAKPLAEPAAEAWLTEERVAARSA
ncbi:EAL domain-containing protein [Dactylosporangium roseum]|uniref:EAL domain-containing protein n=1 Tax=Dactylosporangium roseum TaxID=47989 RepID=A0ABY5ZH51_9ACTN|nr:GGDEF domain-containing phosphodiesterase [Dactylosporangium roseum]UWZ40053.1 EAL domain-containing protein [Dactylosporangium roseum]